LILPLKLPKITDQKNALNLSTKRPTIAPSIPLKITCKNAWNLRN